MNPTSAAAADFSGLRAVVIVALPLLALGSFFVEVVRRRRILRRVANVRVIDLSDLDVRPDACVAAMIDELTVLGFRRVGKAGLAEEEGVALHWYLVDREGTTAAGVSNFGGRGHATIYSWFGEEACIVHSLPFGGATVEQSNYAYRTVRVAPAGAYPLHLVAVREFTARFGAPACLADMREIVRLDAVYNRRFARSRGSGDMRRAGFWAAMALVLAAIIDAILLAR